MVNVSPYIPLVFHDPALLPEELQVVSAGTCIAGSRGTAWNTVPQTVKQRVYEGMFHGLWRFSCQRVLSAELLMIRRVIGVGMPLSHTKVQ